MDNLTSKISRHIALLYQIKNLLQPVVLKSIYYTHIYSVLTYFNLILSTTYSTYLTHLKVGWVGEKPYMWMLHTKTLVAILLHLNSFAPKRNKGKRSRSVAWSRAWQDPTFYLLANLITWSGGSVGFGPGSEYLSAGQRC